MRVGGPADCLITAESTDELVDTVREVDDADEPLLVISGGSNLVISDAGFPGTAVHVATQGIRVESDDSCGGVNVWVAAGESWDGFVEHAVASDWSGIEALSGIPGCAGSTPIQNVGAYGQDVSQTIAQVRTWDRAAQRVVTFANADCAFRYRHSRFKDETYRGTGRYVVLELQFQLKQASLSAPIAYADLARGLDAEQGDRVPLTQAREAVLAQRRKRGMVLDSADHDTWSCGSFFTNPIVSPAEYERLRAVVDERSGADTAMPHWKDGGSVKLSAAWLIEQAGFGKGYGLPGPAALSTKHVLAVTNRGQARAEDIVALARTVRAGVHDVFGVELVNEPVFVGHSL